ncbi:MAG: YeeE/YedE family protein [Silicimonas sp.]|nr:YeeE/YedE family protein [Silicimonas sp.]
MIEALLDRLGDGGVLMLVGVVTGALFGASAQHSRFCLRAATVELSEGRFGPRLATWLVAFSAAVLSVQAAVVFGYLDLGDVRQLASPGSLSGAMIGGAMFGAGMILARGCASRLLVLSGTGNLRALVTGLILTLVAEASLRGALSPAREALSGLWIIEGGEARDLLARLGLSPEIAATGAAVALLVAIGLAFREKLAVTRWVAAMLVGVAVGLGWVLTYAVSQVSFELVPVGSVTFTGPSTDTLMGLISAPEMPLSFGVGLVPGVFLGSAAMALLRGEWAIQRFGPDTPMERYLLGALLMGFGAMLAGGCAVGAGMSGGAVFSLTAWAAVLFMWLGAMATHRMLNRGAVQVATTTG